MKNMSVQSQGHNSVIVFKTKSSLQVSYIGLASHEKA